MTQYDYDLFVIGGGSGGVRAARVAASHGARVALAENDRMGGTCVIRGCVPKKLFVYAARARDQIHTAQAFGWDDARSGAFNWCLFKTSRDQEIKRLEGLYTANLERYNVSVIKAKARLVSAHHITLDDGQNITADKILIATGGTPSRPDIAGAEFMLTSDEFFNLDIQPKRVVLLGGGYIALEFASILKGLGSEVHVIYRGDMILRGFDDDIRYRLFQHLSDRGIQFSLNTNIDAVTRDNDTYRVTLNDGQRLAADCVIAATGRKPNTDGLGLEDAGVATTHRGAIVTNGQAQTSVDGIFAVGDVTETVELTPIAIREGHAFADTVFGSTPRTMHYANIPTAVFTTPEIGTVGLSESIARETMDGVQTHTAEFRSMQTVLKGGEEKIFLKMVTAGSEDRIVGCHMIGGDAGEIIQMAAIALNMGATKQDFNNTIALHPSLAEEWVTI